MAALERLHSSLCTNDGGYDSHSAQQNTVSDQFPIGLRVLVVDDDVVTLKIIEKMYRRCQYHVTTCSQAAVALNLLRERKGCFDVVISDVHMPDMDGYKFLEHTGLEMDLPVIMMSADGSTSAVMKGVKHGACDYLIKPVREEEMRNIWQHVVRKQCTVNKENENSDNLDSNDRLKTANNDVEYASSANDEIEGKLTIPKKRNSSKEDEEEAENKHDDDDPSTSKKPRVVWSLELHQQFLNVVCQLGLDKTVPKRILELMNVPGLTRENVASHLQKFRLYLKRINEVIPQKSEVSIRGSVELNDKLTTLERYNMQALAASGQIPPQTLAAIQAELFGHPIGNLLADDPNLVQEFVQGFKHTPIGLGVTCNHPLARCPPNVIKQCLQSTLTVENTSHGYGAWPLSSVSSVGLESGLGGMFAQNGNMLDVLQQKQQKKHFQVPQQHSLISESSHLINVQPTCLVVPSQASRIFQVENSAASVNQNYSFNTDYSVVSHQQNNSTKNIGQFLDPGSNNGRIPVRHAAPDSISSVVSCSKANSNFHKGSTSPVGQVPVFNPDM